MEQTKNNTYRNWMVDNDNAAIAANEAFVSFVVNTFEELKEVFLVKHDQYASVDPLANFRTASLMVSHHDGWFDLYEAAKGMVNKHIAHMENCSVGGPKLDESLKDIAVYVVIMLYMRARYQEEQYSLNGTADSPTK